MEKQITYQREREREPNSFIECSPKNWVRLQWREHTADCAHLLVLGHALNLNEKGRGRIKD